MTLHLSAQGGKPKGVDFSAWDSLVPPQNRVAETDWQEKNGQWAKDMTFVAFDSARLLLPPLNITLNNGGNAKTHGLTLDVMPHRPRNDSLEDIKGIYREASTWRDYWPYLAVLLALVLLSGLAWWVFRKRSNTSKPQERHIELLPHELALRKLEALRGQELWQKARLKEYYSELTFIVREYLEKRFGLPALESTTDEILHRLRQGGFDPRLEQPLRDVLQWADLAKFAKASPPADFHEAALHKVRALVEATAPAAPAPEVVTS